MIFVREVVRKRKEFMFFYPQKKLIDITIVLSKCWFNNWITKQGICLLNLLTFLRSSPPKKIILH